MRAAAAFRACLALAGIRTVLDVGSGTGEHAQQFRGAGCKVTTVNLRPPADIVGDYLATEYEPEQFDLVWASHVLEHQRNAGAFLERCAGDCRPGGWLAITVPPMKDEVVGGHVGLYNAGVLLYQMILAGVDCRHAAVRTDHYDVSVIVKRDGRVPAAAFVDLAHDAGDIERLAEYFPLAVRQGFDGRIERCNWPWH